MTPADTLIAGAKQTPRQEYDKIGMPDGNHVPANESGIVAGDMKKSQSQRITIKDGASAEVQECGDQQTLRLFAPDGMLMFEYDTMSKRGRAYAPGGNLEVCARGGNIDFTSAERIRLKGEQIEITADRIVTSAGTVINRIANLYQEVQGVTQLMTGRLRTLVSGTWQSKCRRVLLKAEENVKINGTHIHLG